MPKLIKQLLAVVIFLAGIASAACIKVYRTDVQQGNVVTAEMLAKLKRGMTQKQVRFLLGTPLINDPFHPERWDYYYSLKGAGGESEQRWLKLIFKGDILVNIQGDNPAAPGNPNAADPDVRLGAPDRS